MMEEKSMSKNPRCPEKEEEKVDLEDLYAEWPYITLEFSPDYYVE
jgi:hypothetical protein